MTVPALVDAPSGEVATNDVHHITLDFGQEWAHHHGPRARDLFQTPGFGGTIDLPQIEVHHHGVHRQLDPSGIVPLGPDLSGWASRPGCEALGGRPCDDGTVTPGVRPPV